MSSSSSGLTPHPSSSSSSSGAAAAAGAAATGGGGGDNKINIYSLLLFKWQKETPILLAAAVDVSSFPFFHRSTIKEHIIFHSRLIAARTPIGKRQGVEFTDKIGYCYVYNHNSGVCAALLSSPFYPMRVAFSLLNTSINLFLQNCAGKWENVTKDIKGEEIFPQLNDLLIKYKNPTEADKLLKVQKDLDEVKGVMLKNIDDLLQRGEKLDELMQRSEDLSNTSYLFYRQAKKSNSCCSQLY